MSFSLAKELRDRSRCSTAKRASQGVQAEVAIDWSREGLHIIQRCSIKLRNAEVHTQPVLEAGLAFQGRRRATNTTCTPGSRADHSLKYLVAVALLDGEVTPRQFARDRVEWGDVQDLLEVRAKFDALTDGATEIAEVGACPA